MSQPQNPQNPPQQPPSSPQTPHDPQYRIPQYQPHPQQAPHFESQQQWAPAQPGPGTGFPSGPHPSQQPAGFGQKPPKQKKPLLKRWWFWLIVIVVVIAMFSALGGGGDDNSADPSGSGSADGQQTGSTEGGAAPGQEKADEKKADKPAEEASKGIGDTVAADDWEITVAKVEDGVSQVGDEVLNAQAQGQFVQIRLAVKNTGSEPNYFFEDDIKLGDDAGNTYSADSEAGIYAAENNILFLEEINPGNTAEGVLVFDVPEDVDPNTLTFSGGLFSDPVEISLK